MAQRINVTLTDDAYKTLKDTAEKNGQDMSDFVRHSLRVYNSIQRELADGQRIYVGKGNRAEKELVIP